MQYLLDRVGGEPDAQFSNARLPVLAAVSGLERHVTGEFVGDQGFDM